MISTRNSLSIRMYNKIRMMQHKFVFTCHQSLAEGFLFCPLKFDFIQCRSPLVSQLFFLGLHQLGASPEQYLHLVKFPWHSRRYRQSIAFASTPSLICANDGSAFGSAVKIPQCEPRCCQTAIRLPSGDHTGYLKWAPLRINRWV